MGTDSPPADTRSPLRRVLDQRGIRAAYFATSVMGCKPWELSRWASGARPAPPGWFERAALALGVGVDSILPARQREAA